MATQSSTASQFIAAGGLAVGTESSPIVVADASGNLYQEGSEITATAAQLNLNSSAVPVANRRTTLTAQIPLTATTATTGGAVASWYNPEGDALIVISAILDIATKSTGAANLGVGYGSSATGSYTSIFAAQNVGTSAGVFQAPGAVATTVNTPMCVKVPTANYITATGSASTAGLIGNLYVTYVLE